MIGSSCIHALLWKLIKYGQELGPTLSPTAQQLNNHSSPVKVSSVHQMADKLWEMSWSFQYSEVGGSGDTDFSTSGTLSSHQLSNAEQNFPSLWVSFYTFRLIKYSSTLLEILVAVLVINMIAMQLWSFPLLQKKKKKVCSLCTCMQGTLIFACHALQLPICEEPCTKRIQATHSPHHQSVQFFLCQCLVITI